jgi:hypothetical protein
VQNPEPLLGTRANEQGIGAWRLLFYEYSFMVNPSVDNRLSCFKSL